MGRTELSRREFLGRAALAGGVLVGGGILAGCGGSSSAGGSESTAAASTQASTTSPDTGVSTDATAAAPKLGGSLQIGIGGGSTSDNLDAHHVNTNTDGARAEQLYDHLAIRNSDFVLENALAEEFESNASADEWTVRLREGVEFHNGKPLQADDLIFTVKRILDPATDSTSAGTLAFIDPNGMTKVDDRTVKFRLVAACAIFPDLWTPSVYIIPVDYDPKNPIGTGPFKYKSFTPGQESVFERFENYWNTPPYVDTLVLTNYTDDNARMNAMLSGEVDAIDNIPYPQVAVIEGTEGLKLLSSKTGEWRPLTMNVTAPPFDDNRVREAFRLLADRDKMLEQALAGKGRIANDLYAPQDPAYATDIPQREYDPEKAKALLAEANQTELSVELVTSNVKGGLVPACEVFAQSAEAGGVNVKVKNVDSSILYGDQYLKWPFAVDYWPSRSYLLTASRTDGPNAALNETNFNDPEFNNLYAAAFAELNDDTRTQIQHDMQEIQHERGGYIIWAFPDQFDAYSDKVTGFTAGTTGEPFNSYDLKSVWFV